MGNAKWQGVCGVSTYESSNPENDEVIQALNELMDMGFVEIVGINDEGQWLYGSTEEGKKVVRNWSN